MGNRQTKLARAGLTPTSVGLGECLSVGLRTEDTHGSLRISSDTSTQKCPGMDDGEQLIQSNINNTPRPCHTSHLGSFGTPEEAAQLYLQHYQKEHPEALEMGRAQHGTKRKVNDLSM